MEPSSAISTKTLSNEASSTKTLSNDEGISGNPEVENGLLSSYKCPETSTTLHARKSTRYIFGDWGSWPIIFPLPYDDHSYETSNDGQSLSVPPPPLYVPRTPSPDPIERDDSHDTEEKMIFNTVRVVELPGPDGEYNEKFKQFAREAIEWYNNDKGRKFMLDKLVEVISHPVSCIVCVLTMLAVDTDSPNDPPLTFKAEYWWSTIGAKDGVQFCHPK